MTDPSHDLKGHFRDSRVPDRSFSHGSIVNSTSCKSVYLFSSHPFILMDFLYQLVDWCANYAKVGGSYAAGSAPRCT